jgi:hypothetical protein
VTEAVRVRGQKRKRRAENVFGGGKEDAGVESAENDARENVELRSSGERHWRFSTRGEICVDRASAGTASATADEGRDATYRLSRGFRVRAADGAGEPPEPLGRESFA